MFSPFSQYAPSSYRIVSFATVLAKKGHNVTLVLPSYDRYSGFNVEYSDNIQGITFSRPFQLKTRNLAVNMFPYTLSSALTSLNKKFDVVHILKPTPMSCPGYSAKIFSRIPTVQDIDDLDHVIMAAENHSKKSIWFMEQCERIFPHLADKIVVSCSAIRNLYSSMGFKNNVVQISNGVFVKKFETTTQDKSLKDKLCLKEKVIIYVGSLNNEAQLQPLVFSFKKIIAMRKDVSCLIVGDGVARKNLERLANDNGLKGSIFFTGRIPHDKVSQFLSIADVGFACFPKLDYFKYASNIKVFEYMAAGVPAIVNSDGDLPYYVDNGNAGIITNSEPNALSKAIDDVLSDEKKRKLLSDRAKLFVQQFDWEKLTDRLVDVYRSIA